MLQFSSLHQQQSTRQPSGVTTVFTSSLFLRHSTPSMLPNRNWFEQANVDKWECLFVLACKKCSSEKKASEL